MIRLSQRLAALKGYPMAEIPAIKRRLVEAGVDVIDTGREMPTIRRRPR